MKKVIVLYNNYLQGEFRCFVIQANIDAFDTLGWIKKYNEDIRNDKPKLRCDYQNLLDCIDDYNVVVISDGESGWFVEKNDREQAIHLLEKNLEDATDIDVAVKDIQESIRPSKRKYGDILIKKLIKALIDEIGEPEVS